MTLDKPKNWPEVIFLFRKIFKILLFKKASDNFTTLEALLENDKLIK